MKFGLIIITIDVLLMLWINHQQQHKV